MPTETLRFMLSQCHLNQTGPRRVLITRLQESDSTTNTAPQVPDQLSAMIASIVEAKLADLNSSSTSEPAVPPEIEPAQTLPIQPTLTGLVPVRPSVVPTLPPVRSSMEDKMADPLLRPWQSRRCCFHPQELQAFVGGQPPFPQPDSGHHER